MKPDIHPTYRPVVFKDEATGYTFLTRSTLSSDDKVEWEDGKEYPMIKLDISSSSHPFYTGQQRLVDTAGRVERFRRRYSKEAKTPKKAAAKTEEVEEPAAPDDAKIPDVGDETPA